MPIAICGRDSNPAVGRGICIVTGCPLASFVKKNWNDCYDDEWKQVTKECCIWGNAEISKRGGMRRGCSGEATSQTENGSLTGPTGL